MNLKPTRHAEVGVCPCGAEFHRPHCTKLQFPVCLRCQTKERLKIANLLHDPALEQIRINNHFAAIHKENR